MASRALLRRRKYLLNSLNQPSWSSRGFPNFEHDNTSKADNPHILHRFAWHSSSDDTERTNEAVLYSTARHEVSLLTRMGLVGRNTFQVPHSLLSTGWGNYSSICWFRQLSQSRHYSSVATASQSAPSSGNDKNEEDKKVKEASPEECDQAVEGLSSVKAKAKAKKLQESQKSEISVIKRIWSVVLGIGPALKAVASMSREDWANKLLHWKDEFKSTMQHYWLGTKLLWADVRISVRLLLKVARGKGLSRRERQQLTRTTVDIFRLVPFAVFIIVPFMEFLLPVFLKLFPNMLPSTFQDKMKEQEELKRRLTARMELAKFLQNTVKEMAKEVQNSQSGDIKKTAEDLDEFMNKVRKGARVSNDEILSFAKLFDDELTLDNISRPRLVNMCKYMGINPYGTDGYLRYMLQNRLRWIKNDDRMIQEEGVESLSEAELRQACRDRGLLVDEAVATPFRFLLKGARNPSSWLLTSLHDWLDLSLNHKVPSSRLILSRAFSASGKVKPEEAVQATLSSLPDEVVDTVQVTTLPSEDSVSERKRKLEFLEMQEERIKEEELAKMKDSTIREKDVALEEMTIPTAREAQEQKQAKALDKTEQLCELSRALAVLASASSVSKEREEFLRLVKKEIELYNSMVEKEGTEGEEEAKKAYRASREDCDQAAEMAAGDKVSSALINRVDAMLHKLEKEIDDVDAKIGNRWRLLDRDYDGKVTPEEVASAAMYLKDTLSKDGVQDLISNLSKDKDGKIHVQDIVRLGSKSEDADSTEEGR